MSAYPHSSQAGQDADQHGRARATLVAARCFCVALVVAVLCNGLGIYLRKVGVVQPESYSTYWAAHCSALELLTPAERMSARCCQLATPGELAAMDVPPVRKEARQAAQYIFSTTAWDKALKLAKDAVMLGLLAASGWIAGLYGWRTALRPPACWSGAALVVYGLAMFALSWQAHGWLMPAVGLRPLLFVAACCLCGWLLPHLRLVSTCMAVAMWSQLLLLPMELWAGIHINGHGHSAHLKSLDWHLLLSRASGTMAQPNSLGVFAVTSLAFCQAFGSSLTLRAGCGLAALALVYFSGSGVGALGLLMLVIWLGWRALHGRRRRWLEAAAFIAVGLAWPLLPGMLGRPDVFASVLGSGGRLDMLKSALSDANTMELLFGRGLGLQTNLALNLNLQVFNTGDAGQALLRTTASGTDSTLTSLLVQLGVLGVLWFYGALLWAAMRDPRARPFYGVVALCSLALNVTELFPVNLLLGLMLAHSWAQSRLVGSRHHG